MGDDGSIATDPLNGRSDAVLRDLRVLRGLRVTLLSYAFVVFLGEDPRVLAAAALRRVDDERALPQRHAGEAPRQHPRLAAVEDEGPQVHVAALEVAIDQHRHAREAERRLRDVVSRVGLDALAE